MTADLLWKGLLVVAVVIGSVYVHEFGHAIMGWLCGYKVEAFGAGVRSPMVWWRLGGTAVYFAVRSPTQGLVFAVHPSIFPGRWRQIVYFMGGVLANGIAASVSALGMALQQDTVAWRWALAVNCVFAVMSGLPLVFEVGRVRLWSDGALILHLLRGRRLSLAVMQSAVALTEFRPLWRRLGVVGCEYMYTVAAADCARALGDCDEARRLSDEAEQLAERVGDPYRAYGRLARSVAFAQAGDLETAVRILRESEQFFESSGHVVGKAAAAIARANVEFYSTNYNAARAALPTATPAMPAELRHAILGADLWLSVRCPFVPNAADEIDRKRQEFEASRRQTIDVIDLPVYRALFAHYAERGDLRMATESADTALNILDWSVAPGLPPARRERLRTLRAELTDGATDEWDRAGPDVLADLYESGIRHPRLRADAAAGHRGTMRPWWFTVAVLTICNIFAGLWLALTAVSVESLGRPVRMTLTVAAITTIGTAAVVVACGLALGGLAIVGRNPAPKPRVLVAVMVVTWCMVAGMLIAATWR